MKKRFFPLLITLLMIIVPASGLVIFSTSCLSDNEPVFLSFKKGATYDDVWQEVVKFEGKGLPKSALQLVDSIYDQAKSDTNYSQFVKAIIHRLKFKQMVEEDATKKIILELSAEADSSEYPIKPVLQSMMAEMYWQYYQQNYWQFYNRSNTVGFNPEDIATWDLQRIVDACIKNYNASLENADSLKLTRIDLYDDILYSNPDSRRFRPTLYDFLAHRAVDFYKNTQPDIIKPANQFIIKGEEYFASAEEFIKLKITTSDTLSLKYNALVILQDLLEMHINDDTIYSWMDVDLKRLQLLRDYSVEPLKDTLYLRALEKLKMEGNSNPISAEVSYQIANVYYNKGNSYQPLAEDENKWMKKKAYQICEEAIKRFPKSSGAYNCKYLQNEIKKKQLTFTIEAYNKANVPLKALVNYTNLNKIYFRIVKVDRKKYANAVRNLYGEELVKFQRELNPKTKWEQDLPVDKDFNNHSVEIKIPELEFGHYLILASPDEDFSIKENAVAYGFTTISNISYVKRKTEKDGYDFTAMDRESGAPLAEINATQWEEEYSYVLQRYTYKKIRDYKTDENGYFYIPATSDYRNFYVEFKNGDDRLFTNEAFYQYRYYDYDPKDIVIYFFTDRSIYRPGQTVHFKGIVLETNDENNKIVTDFSTAVIFKDANYQKVSELSIKSNEYGTISGSFVIPTGVMNGQMRIETSHGSVLFSVEDYKRPKFEVDFDPVEGSYKLDEKVIVKGNAKAYAGSNIDGATVKYRVSRSVYYPYRWWSWGWYYPTNSGETVITHGSTITDENGEFEIEFTALPDPSVNKKWSPYFNYLVSADVTDINGETHSSSQNVSVGYQALLINTDLTDKVNADKVKEFELKTTNLNGEPVSASGKIIVTRLKENDKLFASRKWTQPDKYLISKEDYYRDYPFELYKDENSISNLKKLEQVLSLDFNTEKEKKISLTNIKSWKQGKYIIEINSIDEFGEEVNFKHYFNIYNPGETAIALNTIDWFTAVDNICEPGEKAQFLVGSKDKDVKILCEVEHKSKIVKKEWISLSDEQKLIEIDVEEKHRGNFAVHFMFVKHNKVYTYDDIINVKRTDKELDIEFATFRNKLWPGQEEEWKIIIKDKFGEKMAAEMVATLYDASLDAFKPHNWYFNIWPYYYSQLNWQGSGSFNILASNLQDFNWNPYMYYTTRGYDQLNWFGFYYGSSYYRGYLDDEKSVRRAATANGDGDSGAEYDLDEEEIMDSMDDAPAPVAKVAEKASPGRADQETLKADSREIDGKDKEGQSGKKNGGESSGEGMAVKARTNFNETAFFYPQLETNENGEIVIKFTIPEALTKWKMLGFAHTKDLKYGLIDNELITQKDMMVMPNVPRFFRENDKITITSKISNVSKNDLNGNAQLMLFDALTMKPIDSRLKNSGAKKTFSAKAGLSTNLKWDLTIPEGIQAVTYRIVAKAGKFSDGEENTIPVMTNRMLVTESMPLPIRGNETKDFKFEKLINSGSSKTLKHHRVTLEFTPNPAWYAVQALPYLMEYPYECAEQVFSRYYANSIASHIANSDPKIKRVFDSWKNTPDSKSLLSNLEKNQELKSLLLEETPWVLDAKDESVRKRRVGLLFDLQHMANNLESAIRKLEKMQVYSGGWTWFRGMPEDRYITQHIVTGLGHLDYMGVASIRDDYRISNMANKGVNYLDGQILKDYRWIKRNYTAKEMEDNHLSYTQIQYLYARSYFMDRVSLSGQTKVAFEYFKGQAEKYWLDYNKYMQGMIALALHRFENKELANKIMASIKEHALYSDEMGMYWKDNSGGYYWYQAPIETQALLIEAFDEITGDKKTVDDMRVWLLKQKQVQDWKTTKATTEAVYALLLRGSGWLATESGVEIKMAGKVFDPNQMEDVKVEEGTGYFKTNWMGDDIKPEMGNITITKKDEGVSWGALYWQYFEQLDKITTHETPLKLKKKLFVERMTDAGQTIEPIEKSELKVGDKVIVRIELRVDRKMEYIHMKDMRASGFEPINVLSQYKYQDGLGYYESTRDIATNFFISNLHKGTFVFEYPLRVTHEGDFSNGITTIQCMYAPEFTSHSEGIRVKIGK